MHALIVVAHPNPNSLTHSVAAKIAEGISLSGTNYTIEVADLAAEKFDPRFTSTDIAVHQMEAPAPNDIAAEQQRIDRASKLVLVYPVYWWSMPALLKGWIDRVFTNGWAYDYGADSKLVKRLSHLPVHLVAVGGADLKTYAKYGYFGAMKTQIDHGIFDYCGARVATSELLLHSETAATDTIFETARRIGREVFASHNVAADAA